MNKYKLLFVTALLVSSTIFAADSEKEKTDLDPKFVQKKVNEAFSATSMLLSNVNVTSIMKPLLELKADINLTDDCGRTTLMLACSLPFYRTDSRDPVAVVRFLIEEKAHLDIQATYKKTFTGCTALNFAAQNNHYHSVKLLLESKANPLLKSTNYKGASGLLPSQNIDKYTSKEIKTMLEEAEAAALKAQATSSSSLDTDEHKTKSTPK